jgi:hypothetical protein
MEARRFIEGHELLCEVFKREFYEEFDMLCELNTEILKKNGNNIHGRNNIYKICVDLCAINHNKRQVRFTEIKKINPDNHKHEGFKPYQLIFLGFVRHIIDSLGDRVFRNDIYEVITEVIVLLPKQRYSELVNWLRLRPVEFDVYK